MTSSSDEFIVDPTDHILAIIEDHGHAEDADRALQSAGFDEVRVYQGLTGAHAIDSNGTEHGMLEQAVRTVQEALSNKDNLAEYQDAVKHGMSVVALRVRNDDRRDEAVLILTAQGAHTINHFGAAVVTTIKA